MEPAVFVTYVRTAAESAGASRLIASIRAFGGEMSRCPVWVFTEDSSAGRREQTGEGVWFIPLSIPSELPPYAFTGKVAACSTAEGLAHGLVESLVWIDPSCLVIQPPVLYALRGTAGAAVRPVHIRNVGSPAGEPLDAYWQGVIRAAGVEDISLTVQPFAGGPPLRAYFNTHAFSVDPSAGLLRRWREGFARLVCDTGFQAGACADELHRIFLHQAVLSALIAVALPEERVRILPPAYNYPYHLQAALPAGRRVPVLNELVTLAYEDCALDPRRMDDIEVRPPLRSWLEEQAELHGG